MCGIFGIVMSENASLFQPPMEQAVGTLMKLSESRGKEASGFAVRNRENIVVYKRPVKASVMVRDSGFKRTFGSLKPPVAVIGHSRLETDGTRSDNHNNQPVVKNGIVCIHNGIIVNCEALWRRFETLNREYTVDSEIIPALVHHFHSNGDSLVEAIRKFFNLIEGSASVALLFEAKAVLILATNTGSLYTGSGNEQNFVFASEKNILLKFKRRKTNQASFSRIAPCQVKPGAGLMIDLDKLETEPFSFGANEDHSVRTENNVLRSEPRPVRDISPTGPELYPTRKTASYRLSSAKKREITAVWRNLYEKEDLKRCTRCVLPETMPFIRFDDRGVCNYCRAFKPMKTFGRERLEALVAPFRRNDGGQECIVPLSGGRDSTYALHYIKTVLKLNPLAFTYDWGVLTDVGRRNQARICGKLGVEHIIISADIDRKRSYVQKNLKAWLKNPRLGMVPILMAGDKQLIYDSKRLKQSTGIGLLAFATVGALENSLFKLGFAGVSLDVPEICQLNIGFGSKLRALLYYARNFAENPLYFNRSLLDGVYAFYCNFMGISSEDYFFFFDYIKWDEQTILSTIIDNYGWEREPDTKATWRIDDGTAPFYNYLYMAVAGFTENDTFRSNQIRHGMITREKAMELVKEENKPRFESLEWYFKIIDFDIHSTIERINAIPRLYGAGSGKC